MKHIFLTFFAIQLSLVAFSVAQITFTREWVTGKRSGMTPKLRILMHEDNQSICKSLLPAIDYLLEVEKVHQKLCGPLPKPVFVPVLLNKYSPLGDMASNPESFDDPTQFEGISGRPQKT